MAHFPLDKIDMANLTRGKNHKTTTTRDKIENVP
jgi:hypothetical protein